MFSLHENLWPGGAPGPPNDIRAPCQPARRCPGSASCPKRARSAGAGSPVRLRARAIRPPPAVRPSRTRPHPFPWLDHPPRGCRVPLPEVRNRGYSYPSGGRVRALQAILWPRIPPDHPPNAQNRRESGFPGLIRLRGLPGHPVGQGLAHGRILTASPVVTDSAAGGSGQDRVGRTRRPRRGSARPRPRRRAGKPRGQRGRGPPPASAGDARSVAPRSKLA